MNHVYLEIYFYYCGLHLVLLNDMIIVSSYIISYGLNGGSSDVFLCLFLTVSALVVYMFNGSQSHLTSRVFQVQ
jgi:hypothetical protein